jgi:hypothetical protein
MLGGAVAVAAGSVALHLKQAKDLGKAENDCDLRFAVYEVEKRKELARLEANMRMRAEVQAQKLRLERDAVSQELQALRAAFDTTIDAFEGELEEMARQQPEIVPWLDTPVPQSLLQD